MITYQYHSLSQSLLVKAAPGILSLFLIASGHIACYKHLKNFELLLFSQVLAQEEAEQREWLILLKRIRLKSCVVGFQETQWNTTFYNL